MTDHIWVIIPDAMVVLFAEILVDWIKHAFILKFNEIPADVRYSRIINKCLICDLSTYIINPFNTE